MVDAQQVLRHRRITTTSTYLRSRIDEVITKVHEHYTRPKSSPRPQPQPQPLTSWTYDPDDLADVFGNR